MMHIESSFEDKVECRVPVKHPSETMGIKEVEFGLEPQDK